MKLLLNEIQEKLDDFIKLSFEKDLLIPPHYFDTNKQKYSLEDVKRMWHKGVVASSKERHDALYIHIPFCISRCAFCMYESQIVRPEYISPYISRIIKEYRYWEDEVRMPLDSMYIGGGTPSIMSVSDISSLFNVLNELSFSNNSSRTFELSPETATEDKLYLLGDTIINRISIGIQSMDENVLKMVKRNNISSSHIKRLLDVARKINFDDINIDVMVGLEGQTENNVQTTIEKIVEMAPLSVTLYSFRDTRKTSKKNIDERIMEVRKQIQRAYKTFDLAGWKHVAGNVDTEYNIFYSEDKKKELIRQKTSIDVFDNLNLFGLGSHAIGFNPALAYECDSFSMEFNDKDRRYAIYQHTPLQQMQLAICTMLYCNNMCVDTVKFFHSFKYNFEDIFKEELDELMSINRVTPIPGGYKFICNTKYEAAAIQKFFWDKEFLRQYSE